MAAKASATPGQAEPTVRTGAILGPGGGDFKEIRQALTSRSTEGASLSVAIRGFAPLRMQRGEVARRAAETA